MAIRVFSENEKILAMRAILAKRFPACFMTKGNPVKLPLKIGIRHDILARCPDLDAELVGRAIRDYVNGPRYARCMRAGSDRIDLDGNPCGQVSEADQQNATFREKNRSNKAQANQRARTAIAKIEAEARG
jgi:ProP effector